MFDSWLEQEKAVIRSRFGKVRILCVLIAVLMVPPILMQVIFLLDGDGVMTLIPIAFFVFVMCFALSMGNYKKRFIKPLLASVRQELTTREAQEEFARQMQEQAGCISYQPLPQVKACEIMVAKEYCYMRQPGKSRIIQNRQLRRAVLTKEQYTVGRGHIRWCYALALYAADEKPVWKGYFMEQEKAAQAFQLFQKVLPPEALVQDEISDPQKGPREPLWKSVLKWVSYIIFLAVMILLVRRLRH